MAQGRKSSTSSLALKLSTIRGNGYAEHAELDRPTVTVTEEVFRRASLQNPRFGDLQADAKDASLSETSMPFREAVQLYRKAILWSILLSAAVVMEGYDYILLSNFFALPAFNRKYGNQTLQDGTKTISAAWRSGLTNGAAVGEILGLFATGILQDRFGYKKTIGGALAALTCFIFITFFAVDLGMLLAGEILCGLCWGVFQTITTAYASEVTPVALRAYLTTYVNMCWVFGQLLGSGILRAMLTRDDVWSYRVPFAIQWVWPIPILVGCLLCPESPWWLVRQNRHDDAKYALSRLTSPSAAASSSSLNFDLDKTIAMMEHTTQLEQQALAGTSYADCFRGTNLRRTEISCVTWLVQTVCGASLMGYSTVFYEAAGLPTDSAFNLTIGIFALGACGTLGSWWLMAYAGRRTLYLAGSIMLFFILLAVGLCGIGQSQAGPRWAIGSLLLIYALFYDLTIGPVCYSLVTEIPSTRLKAKTIVLARNTFNIGSIIVNILTNYMLTPTAWAWGAYSGFFWAGICLLCAVWIYWRLPEPSGRTYAALDILFENRISARRFRSTNVDIFKAEGSNAISYSPSDASEKMPNHVVVQDVGSFSFKWNECPNKVDLPRRASANIGTND